MFSGIPQPYIIDIYGFYFEEYMHGYLLISSKASPGVFIFASNNNFEEFSRLRTLQKSRASPT